MKDLRAQRGAAAEELAAHYLQVRGLKILARNLRCKAGEIDLVCLDDGVLAIVEVRQREGLQYGGALGSVTKPILVTPLLCAAAMTWAMTS